MSGSRIENKRFEKTIRFLKWGAIISLLIAILKIAFNSTVFNGKATPDDFILTLIPITLFLQYRKTAKKMGRTTYRMVGSSDFI